MILLIMKLKKVETYHQHICIVKKSVAVIIKTYSPYLLTTVDQIHIRGNKCR